MCIRYGADVVGFVAEYPRPVPWNLSAGAARALIASAGSAAETCVVTGGAPEKIFRLALETGTDYVQLHFGESLNDTARLVRELHPRGVKVIKTLFPDTPDLEKATAEFCAAGVYALLFDPRRPENAAEGGAADLSVFRALQNAVSCPVILAGGITPENAAEIVRAAEPQMIDLMTGVEFSPGVKDEAKVTALFETLKEF
ncbi:MAG: phosphoribosylanthranilate isomerase [Firmicutes bacterium]|nr:phosphoribosylanthranilate isomerase [Bacillota bacterium]